jgi:LL-diaminopimelate aminotransferase
VQEAAYAALIGDQSWIRARNEIYRRRRDKLCAALGEIGIRIVPPKASLYLWAPVPGGYTSAQFAELMLSQIGVAVTSGASYGTQGEGWFRVSLTVSDEEVDQATARFPKLQF